MARIPRGVRVRQAYVDMEGGRVIPVFQNIFRQVVRRLKINRGSVNAEHVRLLDSLRGSGTAVVRRTVRREQEQGPALVVRFHHSGEQFRRSRTGRGHHGCGQPHVLNAPQREKRGGTFVKMGPFHQILRGGQHLQQRHVARAGADYPFTNAAQAALGQQGLDEGRGGVHGS